MSTVPESRSTPALPRLPPVVVAAVVSLLLAAVFFLSQGPAAQDAVTYTFVTGDEPFGSALAISLMVVLSVLVTIYIIFAGKEERFGA